MHNRLSHRNTLVFIHIPKTAGSTLNQILRKQYSQDSVFETELYKDGVSVDSVHKLKKLSDEVKREKKLIRGHMGFGVHDLIPQNASYFAIFRNPIKRVISFHHFIQHRDSFDKRLYNEVKLEFMDVGKMSLEEFIDSEITAETRNGQTRRLAGTKGYIYPADCTIETYNKAIHNIDNHFSFLGVTESFDESLMCMKSKYKWHDVHYVRSNVSKGKPSISEIDGSTLKKIIQHNKYDLMLYEYVRHKWGVLRLQHLSVPRKTMFTLYNKRIHPYREKIIRKAKEVFSL